MCYHAGMSKLAKSLLFLVVSAVALLPLAARAQQTVQLVNDNSQSQADSDVWVLFVGNPANVTANGSTISGLRNLAIPTASVSTSQSEGATVIQSALLQSPTFTVPAAPFPLDFISGANAGTTVKVTAYDASTGTLTVDPTSPLQAQAAGDQFVVGAYSQSLSSLPLSGTISSTLSGQTPNVYEVEVQLESGVIYISSGQLTYLSAAPKISASSTPFQTVEVTTGSGSGTTTSDLTVIDYFSIPLQIQSVDNSSSPQVISTRTFYLKRSTIEAGIQAIGARSSDDFYLGPGQITAANNGDPAPFPSFKSYLQALVSQSFSIAGAQNFGTPNPATVYGVTVGGNYQSTYAYTTSLSETDGNFTVTMTPQAGGNSFTNAPPYFPDVSNVESMTINLPQATTTDPAGYDAIIYGAVLDSSSFTIQLEAGAPSLTPTTLSGPFSVTSATNTTEFSSAELKLLATALLSGLTVQFTSGGNAGSPGSAITSVDSSGNVQLATPLTTTPSANDQFEVLFSVTSPGPQNTTTFFGASSLSQAALNYLAPFTIEFATGANAGETAQVVALDAAGNVTLKTVLTNVPQTNDLFSVSVPPSGIFTQLYTNSTYSWAVADVLAGLNFGFPGSPTAGSSSAEWYGIFPQQFPFGLARGTPDDGYYNPWAAYFYNASDAYAFAFNDRIAPSPLMGTNPSDQYFRITVLPETQIDAPLVTVTSSSASGIDLAWPVATGITYTVTTLPPIPASQISVDSAAGTASLTGLQSGTPYEILVQGSLGSQQSLVLPLYSSTSGSVSPTTGNVPFGFAFTWAAPNGLALPSQYAVFLNGTQLELLEDPARTKSNLAATGNPGSNLYVLDFQDTTQSNRSVFKAVVRVDIECSSSDPDCTSSFSLDGAPTIFGSIGALSVAPAGPTYAITQNAPPVGPTSPLVLNIDFNPQERKELAPVTTP